MRAVKWMMSGRPSWLESISPTWEQHRESGGEEQGRACTRAPAWGGDCVWVCSVHLPAHSDVSRAHLHPARLLRPRLATNAWPAQDTLETGMGWPRQVQARGWMPGRQACAHLDRRGPCAVPRQLLQLRRAAPDPLRACGGALGTRTSVRRGKRGAALGRCQLRRRAPSSQACRARSRPASCARPPPDAAQVRKAHIPTLSARLAREPRATHPRGAPSSARAPHLYHGEAVPRVVHLCLLQLPPNLGPEATRAVRQQKG